RRARIGVMRGRVRHRRLLEPAIRKSLVSSARAITTLHCRVHKDLPNVSVGAINLLGDQCRLLAASEVFTFRDVAASMDAESFRRGIAGRGCPNFALAC